MDRKASKEVSVCEMGYNCNITLLCFAELSKVFSKIERTDKIKTEDQKSSVFLLHVSFS